MKTDARDSNLGPQSCPAHQGAAQCGVLLTGVLLTTGSSGCSQIHLLSSQFGLNLKWRSKCPLARQCSNWENKGWVVFLKS